VSDLSELFEQLADGPVLLATAFDSVNADYDNGSALSSMCGARRGDGDAAPRVGEWPARNRCVGAGRGTIW
jgi:hypothetical protein